MTSKVKIVLTRLGDGGVLATFRLQDNTLVETQVLGLERGWMNVAVLSTGGTRH